MKIKLLFIFIHSTLVISAQKLNTDSLQKHYNQKVKIFLDKEGLLSDYISITKDGISLYASGELKNQNKSEFNVQWKNLLSLKNDFKTLNPETMYERYCKGNYKDYIITGGPIVDFADVNTNKPLLGKKIAIDPGHIGGDSSAAKLERKYVKVYTDSSKTNYKQLIEGNLTFATALSLKQKLEQAGASVMLTRIENGNSFGISYTEWKEKYFKNTLSADLKSGEISFKQYNYYLKKASDKIIFRDVFLKADLKMRAMMINNFKPDLTIVIHYNVDEENKGWTKTSDKNYNMVFVPGSFMKQELNTQHNRFEFLHLLVSANISNSINAAAYFTEEFKNVLNVPNALPQSAGYLTESCIPTDATGVFCRNLSLTRLVHGTIVYGETLYQDNRFELNNLSEPPQNISGMLINARLAQVAQAYYQATLNYFTNK
jgi:N-acetylmuramoyl-L-alanine amidase